MAAEDRSKSYEPPQKIVICGAGLHGCALAYYLTVKAGHKDVTVVEKHSVAAAASGKGGGFLARDWGSGPTVQLHEASFALHAELARELGLASYRTLPVLSVQPGKRPKKQRAGSTVDLCPWLDGPGVASSSLMDADGGAQVAPLELCTALMDAAVAAGAKLVIGSVEGVSKRPAAAAAPTAGGEGVVEEGRGLAEVTGVVLGDGTAVPGDAVAVCLGPWSSRAAAWLDLEVPITGIKSTSVVFRSDQEVEPFALFCGEDPATGTHLEVYPRASGEVYLCGIGGSEYVSPDQLRAGAYPPGEVHPAPKRVAAAAQAFGALSTRLAGPHGGRQPDLAQACMRPCAPDALPMMGKVGHLKGAYLSAGHNCWGILWAPVSGKAMAELLLEGAASCIDLAPFAPGRFTTTAAEAAKGGRGRKRGTAAVGEQW